MPPMGRETQIRTLRVGGEMRNAVSRGIAVSEDAIPAANKRRLLDEAVAYLTRLSILNIGRYIAMTMTPTISPTRIIISGSTMDVSDWIAASTSSS
jgi:hypothetical protein